MSANKINEDNEKILPYIEALSFFEHINEISYKFPRDNKYKLNSFKDFIENFKKNIIIEKKDIHSLKQEKNYIQANPQKIFYFFLDELHNLYKDNKEDNKSIKAIEYDKDKAIQYFKDFCQKDKSIISELFFGTKLIIKNCRGCNMTQYDCRYLKVIPLDIRNTSGELHLEKLYESIMMKDNRNLFCQMCSEAKEFNIKIIPKSKSKYLIFIICYHNPKARVNIPQGIFNNSYRLISAEIEYNKKSMCKSLFNCSNSKKKYKFFFNSFNYKELHQGSPYVLFYERDPNYLVEKKYENYINNNEFDLNPTQNDKTDICINYEKNYNNPQFGLNNKNQLVSKSNNASNSFINNFNLDDNQPDTNSNDKLTGDINKITLIFRFENEKEYCVETEDCNTFKNIIALLIDQYKLDQNDINENEIYYCNKKIKYNETPKDVGIEEKAYIYIR
jgi:hypothetical protein